MKKASLLFSLFYSVAAPILVVAGGAYYSDVPHYDQSWFEGGDDCLPNAATQVLGWHDAHGWPALVQFGGNDYEENPTGVINANEVIKDALGYDGDGFYWWSLIGMIGDRVATAAHTLDSGASWWTDDDEFTSWTDMKGQIDSYGPMLLNVPNSFLVTYYYGTLDDGDPDWGFTVKAHAMCMYGYSEGVYKVNAVARWTIVDTGWGNPSPAWINYDDSIDLYTVEFHAQGTPAAAPSKPTSPSPANYSTGVSRNADLSWANGGGATSYDVYFGTANPPGEAQFKGNQVGTSYDPGTLAYDTTYFWRIDAMSATGPTAGDVWRFTTESLSGSDVTLTSVADSWLYEASPNSNYGTLTETSVAGVMGSRQRAVVRFNVSGIPSGSTINSVELKLYARRCYNPDNVNTYLLALGQSWSETTVTWNNQPSVSGDLNVWQKFTSTGYHSWQSGSFPALKTLVQAWVNGTKSNYGFLMEYEQGHDGDTAYYTREWGTSAERPKLIVNYTPPPTGSLTVYINPADVRNQGAQWKLTSGPDTSYHNSGDTISDLPTGDYTLYFSGVAGWTRPPSHNTTITISVGANSRTDTYGFDVSPPTGVSASDGAYTDKARIQWNASSGATEYEVWRNTVDSSGSSSRIGDHIAGTSYNDYSGTEGQTYYYWVKAKNSAGTTGFSASDSGYRSLPAPANVSASDAAFSDRIRVTWDAVLGATSYEVWRNTSDDSGSAAKISSPDPTGTTFDDFGVAPETPYWYWVKSKTAAGPGVFSASDQGSRLPGIEIVTASLPAGMEMVPYNATLQATNGTPPYTWSVAEGYTEGAQANSFSAVGTAWQSGMDETYSLSLPFAFPFYGATYSTCYVDIHGTVYFVPRGTDYSPSENTLAHRKMIAVLWRDYYPDAVSILIESGTDTLTIRWQRGTDVDYSATLNSDGTVTLRYGSGNTAGGMIGISGGDGQNYLLSSKSQSGSMENAADIVFTPVGRLPDGLACSTNGIVAGTPTFAVTSVVTFVVQDSVGASTNKPLEIVIAPNPNTRPVISSNAPPAGAFSMGEATSQLFRVWAYDPEGSNLTYSWTWDGTPVGGNASSYTHTTAWGDAGQYVLRCYVSDDLWQNIVYSQWTVTVLDDNDGDGMPNWQELDLGRNPNDPSDAGNTSTLAGTVRGGGLGLSDAYVELRGAGGTTYHRTLTASDGTYFLYSVLPGHYYAKAGAERFADEWYDNATHRTSAVPYSVPADSIIAGFDFDLAPGQNPALVEVTSDPAGAAIYLDYQPTADVTPAVLTVGEVGDWDWTGYRIASHVITVKKTGRPRPSPRPVAAKEAETVSVHFDMTSDAIGSVSVATIPDGTAVYIDYADSADGISPVVVGNLAPGSHVILLKQTGYLQPRTVLAWALEGLTNEVSLPMTANTAPDRLIANARSVPPGATVYVDYLPTTNVTDVVVDWMDPASHTGSGWHSASHTIMLRKSGFLPAAPRYVPDRTNETQTSVVHLIGDSVAAVDEDHDGMPDQWEEAYRLRELAPGQHGANDDPDNDGSPNIEEMGAGTNPLDGNSCLLVADLTVSPPGPGQTVTFIFDTVPGRTYIVQCTDELKSGWTNLSGLILATDYQTAYTTQIPEGTAHQFYRLIVLTP